MKGKSERDSHLGRPRLALLPDPPDNTRTYVLDSSPAIRAQTHKAADKHRHGHFTKFHTTQNRPSAFRNTYRYPNGQLLSHVVGLHFLGRGRH